MGDLTKNTHTDLNNLLDEDTLVTNRLKVRRFDQSMTSEPVPRDRGIKTQLIVLTGADSGKIHILSEKDLVGRDLSASLRGTDTTVSRKHALITRAPSGRYFVTDLGSQNGTWLNGATLTGRTELTVGDKIRVGVKTVLLFTQQDNIELQLLELRKMESLGRLARGIAHDFNNLLATVMLNVSYIEVMTEDGAIDTEELTTSLEQTKVALKQAANMTEQLLGFARKGRYEERPRNVSAILEEVVSLISRTFNKTINVKTNISPDLAVVGDQSQLLQVFMNLCINARDAMPKGGTLTISAHMKHLDVSNDEAVSFLSAGPHVVISVQDTGVGMDEKTRQHIFEPFFSTKGLGKGNGLGLATVYGIVKNHGGEIQVDSQIDSGTTFHVYLPASEMPITTETMASRLSPKTLVMNSTILLVEDDEKLRSITEKTLRRIGYGVIACADGQEAIAKFRENRKQIQLVLLDLILPKVSGHEVFFEIRKLAPRAKIVVVSGYSEDEQLREIMQAGAAAFVKKPCSAEDLAVAIADVLTTKKTDTLPLATIPSDSSSFGE
jgi:two-component system, cell cycle sensor histidine kinase and response regulator CckA